MASSTPSHQVSQPIAATWLDDPPVPAAPDPLKQNNGSPTAPISTSDHTKPPTTTVTSVSLPVHVHGDSQDQASSLSLSYQNPSSSPPLTTQAQQSAHFSNVPSPSQNQAQSFGHQERSPVVQQSQALSDPKRSSPNNVFIPSSAQLQPETLPPNQFGQLQQQTQDDRQSTASNRFANLLNVSNRANAQYPVVVSQPQPVHSDQFLPPAGHPASQAQQIPNDSMMGYRAFRDVQSGSNPRYTQNGLASQPYQASHAQNKLFEGIEQMAKQESQFLHTQGPPHVNQAQGHEEQIRRQLQSPSRQHQQAFQQWQTRVPHSSSLPQHSQAQNPTYAHQNGYQLPMGSQGQLHGRDSSHLRDQAYEAANKYRGVNGIRNVQSDGSSHMNGYRPLPSARSLQHTNGLRPVHLDGRADSGYRTTHGIDMSNGTRTIPNGRSRNGPEQTIAYHAMGISWELVSEAVKAYQSPENTADREEFLATYLELLRAYEDKCEAVYDSVDAACVGLIVNSRVPYLVDTITAPVDDETPEDAQQKLIVKKKFVEAMERLQGDQLPTKRRGNLPKESTAYLKRWFDEHYDHPCKLLQFICSDIGLHV